MGKIIAQVSLGKENQDATSLLTKISIQEVLEQKISTQHLL